MRDTHRLKEKYELSFDNRQVVTLTVASLVVLGGTFFLGVVVGKKLASTEPGVQRPAADLLSAADKKTQVKDELDASLTFPEELTRAPAPAAKAGAAAAAPAPAVAQRAPPAPAKEAPRAEETTSADLDAALKKLDEEEARQADEAKAEADAPRKAESLPTRTHTDAGGLKDAFGRAQAAPKGTTADGNWTIQLSAYQDRAEAERFAAGLRDKGYAPFIVEANIPSKGTWFRVRMGRFPSKDAAGRYMDDFKRETSMNAIVTTN